MEVSLLDYMGSDLTVVNAARVSFAKESKWDDGDENWPQSWVAGNLKKQDVKLLKYLATHGHWSPFAHPQLSFRIKAPIFVARQLVKHQVGLTWNEISRRYVDNPPEFYRPREFRGRPVDKKQGSSGHRAWTQGELEALDQLDQSYSNSYAALLKDGMAPELARIFLPLSTYTEWIWTGSLYAFHRVCNLRLKEDAQYESRLIANNIYFHCLQYFPYSWKALNFIEESPSNEKEIKNESVD